MSHASNRGKQSPDRGGSHARPRGRAAPPGREEVGFLDVRLSVGSEMTRRILQERRQGGRRPAERLVLQMAVVLTEGAAKGVVQWDGGLRS